MRTRTRKSGLLVAAAAATIVASGSIAFGSGGISTGGGGGGSKGKAFPVRGKHTYGDGIGAGRGHQGQDILANCRKPVVAARAGRVRYIDYQASGAGNYVVVKGKKFDYVYMHMLKKPSVRKGERLTPESRSA